MSDKPKLQFDAHVTFVRDGDTFWALVDLKFDDIFKKKKIRLDDLNAPELHLPDGSVNLPGVNSLEFLRNLIDGKDVVIVGNHCEKFDRFLATVMLDGVNVNQLLLDRGMAKPYHGEKRV